jgi:hypothetical protein
VATEPGFFEAFYASALHHPLLLWLAVAVGLGLCLARRDLHPSLRRYGVALALLSGLDAWLTANHVLGLGALSATLASVVPLAFVLAGDYRYWLLVVAATPDGRLAPGAQSWLEAAGLTLLVPIFAQLAVRALPDTPGGPRALYLIYELSFTALAASLPLWHPNVRANRWLRSLGRFVMLYYGLWATADVILLTTGADLGYALRVLPNLLYYGGLIAAIAWLAPGVQPDTATRSGT